jgi:type VI secretion system protein ImpH
MAAPDGPASDHLRFLAEAAGSARRWGFFPLVRGAEARARGLPRVGRSRAPAQNVADMAHAPRLDFPGATLDAIEPAPGGRMRVRGTFLGLTGPMGPLPIHLTEFAWYERRYGDKQPFGRWLDLLTDRMLQFFYRAWADSQPAAHADRPEDDRFADYLAALSGAREGAATDGAFPAAGRLHYAGVFASRRSAASIQDGLQHLMRTPVRIREFIPRMREIEPEDRTRIGGTGAYATLGRDAVLGGRVLTLDDTFRVVVRARDLAEYETLLPGGSRFAAACEALEAFKPSHLDWELEVEVAELKAGAVQLGRKGRLGWSSWALGKTETTRIRADARLRRRANALD